MYCEKNDIYVSIDKNKVRSYLSDTQQNNDWEIILDKLIKEASNEIDGYLRNRYSVPLEPIPPFIKDICTRIVRYKIVTRKGFPKDAPEYVIVEDYKMALKQLERIMNGELDIGIQVDEEQSITKPKIIFRSKGKIFNDDFWEGFN